MPQPSRATAHHVVENAPTETRAPLPRERVRSSTLLGHSAFALGMALPAPYLPFAIPVGTSGAAQLGGFTTFGSPMTPGGNSTVPLSARVDPLGRPGARPATRGMSFSILSSQRQSKNSDTLLLAPPTAQEH
jgi:hypothetical protein